MVARRTIKSHVLKILSAVTGMEPPGKIKETDRLKQTLLLSKDLIRALARPYTKVSEKYGGVRITQSQAGKLKTVKASINLVNKKANTKPTAKKKAKKTKVTKKAKRRDVRKAKRRSARTTRRRGGRQ